MEMFGLGLCLMQGSMLFLHRFNKDWIEHCVYAAQLRGN